MTKIQRAFCVLLSVCFLAVLYQIPDPFHFQENLYRQLPVFCFLENQYQEYPLRADEKVSQLIVQSNAEYLGELVQEENEDRPSGKLVAFLKSHNNLMGNVVKVLKNAMSEQVEQAVSEAVQIIPRPVLDLSLEKLADTDYLLNHFFIVDSNTSASSVNLDGVDFLERDLSIEKNQEEPQILIYHTHSQETFADSREGMVEDTIVGVGAYLTEILTEQYGYQVIHVTEAFDMAEGTLDRSAAYDYSRAYVERLLEEYPSIEVVIDLHRDGVAENRRLVTTIQEKDTAQIMFYNGLSYTNSYGAVDYLPNPYIQDNLAFSFQLEYQAALYYPDFYRGIYLAGLRYNLHLRPRALLLEAGAQTNTVQEVKNAMEPFADILNRVLSGTTE